MSLFTVATWLVGGACIVMVASAALAIITGDTVEGTTRMGGSIPSICTPSRARMLTGANLDRQQLTAIQQDSEELQRQAAEIERLQAVIRQRNRTIKRLRAQLEQPVEQAQLVTVGTVERFEWLEIRGQSCE